VLACAALGAVLLLLLTMSSRGSMAMWSALAIGLCNSIMFPTIFALAVAELGPRTGEGSGVLCMAIVGGAIVPVVMGYFADHIGLSLAFFVPVLCYAFIVHYGFVGHRVR
jgi:FHS family L-fucose permease-like MFS transporter